MVFSAGVPYHPALSCCDQLVDPPPAEPATGTGPSATDWDARLWGALVVLCGIVSAVSLLGPAIVVTGLLACSRKVLQIGSTGQLR